MNNIIRAQLKAQLTRPPKDAYDRFGNLSMREKILDRIKYHTDFLLIDTDRNRSRYHREKLEALKEMLEEVTKLDMLEEAIKVEASY